MLEWQEMEGRRFDRYEEDVSRGGWGRAAEGLYLEGDETG